MCPSTAEMRIPIYDDISSRCKGLMLKLVQWLYQLLFFNNKSLLSLLIISIRTVWHRMVVSTCIANLQTCNQVIFNAFVAVRLCVTTIQLTSSICLTLNSIAFPLHDVTIQQIVDTILKFTNKCAFGLRMAVLYVWIRSFCPIVGGLSGAYIQKESLCCIECKIFADWSGVFGVIMTAVGLELASCRIGILLHCYPSSLVRRHRNRDRL